MTEQFTDYDSPWKEVIELYFSRFLEFFFTQAYAEIDWTRPYEFLDTELQQLEPDAEIRRRLVDKVAKVWLLDGEEAWVLVHVEVQGQYDSQFAERMYTYNYRLFDRYKKRVISLAVLAIITVLETQFGEVPSSIVEVINGIEKPSVLKMLHKSAMVAKRTAFSTRRFANGIVIPSTAEFQQVLDRIAYFVVKVRSQFFPQQNFSKF
ncbi:hypothetical protein [Nostoc sp.]|uniref:hypothetical protein n=1 Tax=Nostoc sp. TaxID=1180 RepID=UPI002FF5CC60